VGNSKIEKDTGLPEAFERRMKEQLGAEFESFKEALSMPPPVSVRVNTLKAPSMLKGDPVPWCSTGLYLEERPVFTLDPHLHAGAYYVQEPSSMYLEQVVKRSIDLTQPLKVLDLCAAPGGKSTHLLQLINDQSLLVSNEVIRPRASILSENIQKWGKANAVVTNNDPRDFGNLRGFFDLIVVDAPCSGEGLFRKDKDAMEEWSVENVNLCSVRQRRVLSDVWPALKENGVLIYCTCTYAEAENELNAKWLSEEYDLEILEAPRKFMPHRDKGEGFFITSVRKRSKENTVRLKGNDLKLSRLNPGWLNGEFKYYEFGDLLVAFNSEEALPLNIISRGVAVASIKKNKLIPEHALALSIDLNNESFPVVDVDKEEALKYLSKQTIEPKDSEKGFALIRYQNNNLGFVNRLGNRINNLYPANWRIRMDIRGT